MTEHILRILNTDTLKRCLFFNVSEELVDLFCRGVGEKTNKFAQACYKVWASRVAQGKESACSARDKGFIPGSGRSPGVGYGYPFQYSCLRIPWTEELSRIKSTGSQRVGYNWSDWAHMHITKSTKDMEGTYLNSFHLPGTLYEFSHCIFHNLVRCLLLELFYK